MARIIYGALVESIRGSIGGTTFQKNKYGYTVKHKPNMTKPWTADQLLSQIYFTKAVRAWREAVLTTRQNWNTWAATNPQYAKHNPSAQLSGFACFVKWHAYEFQAGLPVDNSPALAIPAVINPVFKIILAAGVLTLQHTWTGGAEDWNVAFYLSRPFGSAQNFIGTKTRYIFSGTDATASKVITVLYPAKFGSLPALGDRIAVDFVEWMESGGAVITRQQIIVTVTAS